jgi:Zn finger protein HypA/HybF involved in hydrogenase expression/very-short-patch-repair endonuclease
METWNIGEVLDKPEFNDLYVRFFIDKETDTINEKIYKLINGEERVNSFDFSIDYSIHKIKINSFTKLHQTMNSLISVEEICERADNSDKILLEYVGNEKSSERTFLVKCKNCGEESYRYMRKFGGCRGCARKAATKDTEFFQIKALSIHYGKYDYSDSVYIGTECKIKIFCKKCDKYFYQTPHNHLSGKGCPICKESKGEIRIGKFLSDNNIFFIRQHKFDDLKNINHLKLDFFVPSWNMIIEYDGQGHDKPVFGKTMEEKIEKLKKTQQNDRLKDNYAINNNINMLRINWRYFKNIEKILEKSINDFHEKENVI